MKKKDFTISNYKWSLDGLISCIEENKLKSKIILYNENIAVVHVVSYEESRILGADTDWCISQHIESWEQYVKKDNGIQLFFYCFRYPVYSDNSLYGATFTVKEGTAIVNCCFTREDNPIGNAHGFNTDTEALFNVVSEEFGGDELFQEICDIVCKINEDVKPEEKNNKKHTDGFADELFNMIVQRGFPVR